MDIISSAKNSNFPHRNPSKIFKEKGDEEIVATGNAAANFSLHDEEKDLIELSKDTKQVLQQLEKDLEELVAQYPKFGKLLFPGGSSSYKQRLQGSPLANSFSLYEHLLNHDPEFEVFHYKTQEIQEKYQRVLHDYQAIIRTAKPHTYKASLFGL